MKANNRQGKSGLIGLLLKYKPPLKQKCEKHAQTNTKINNRPRSMLEKHRQNMIYDKKTRRKVELVNS